MTVRKGLWCAVVTATVLGAAACAAVPREPVVLPTVGVTYAVPYDAVWDATLKSLGAVKPVVADKARGRIESEQYTFYMGRGQTLWISLAITVRRTDPRHTSVEATTRVHDSILTGVLPGPISNPWVDLFARIQGNLGLHG